MPVAALNLEEAFFVGRGLARQHQGY